MSIFEDSRGNHISFPFFPFDWEHNQHMFEKADTAGNKRRYLIGIASGIQIDGHGEHLTKNAVNSIQRQANSGDILLYGDVHGIRDNEDIGILEKSEITPTFDWKTTFRLYDEFDELDDNIVKANKKLWKKMNGEPPYTKRRKKGFSIEGYVPSDKIISYQVDKDGRTGKRVIDDVLLDGVVLVPKPAYNSVAEAVCKCLGILPSDISLEVKKTFDTKLQGIIEQKNISNQFFNKRYDIENALDEMINNVMKDNISYKKERLEMFFKEYNNLMIDLILNSADIFREDGIDAGVFKANDQSEKIKQLLIKTQNGLEEIQGKIKQGVIRWKN